MASRCLARLTLCALAIAVTACDPSSEVPAEEDAEELARPRSLLVLPDRETPIAAWMKARGWETQRGHPRHFRVDADALRMVSRKDSVAIGLRRGFPQSPRQRPLLRFRFRVHEIPTGTDLTKKAGDDAAFRLYVAFDRDKGWIHPPHTIAYTWTESHEPETVIRSAHFRQLRYLSLGRGRPEREGEDPPPWITVTRDLVADYRKVFAEADERVPAVVGILLKCDSNDTGASARADVAMIELRAPPTEEGD